MGVRLLTRIVVYCLSGALLGLVPFFLGRYFAKPGLGKLSLLICTLTGILVPFTGNFFWPLPVCVAFSIAVFVKKHDFLWPQKQQPQQQRPAQQHVTYAGASGGLTVICLSGPMRGQIYPIGQDGLKFGRDNSCAVRFPDGTTGISREHCAIRYQQGVAVLVDLNSTYGTYLGNGQKLPPQLPTEIAAGSRFYLGSTGCLFQVRVS